MTNSLLITLLISLVGMSLVFLIIVLFWGVMALLTKVFKDRENPNDVHAREDAQNKQIAAALAVSLALQNDSVEKIHEFPLPPTALVSAWQAVMRSAIISKRGRVR